MTTSRLNTSDASAVPTTHAHSSNVLIVGGKRSGEYIRWFGNRVFVGGVFHVLHRVYFTDGRCCRYYVREGEDLWAHLHSDTVDRIEVMG